MLAYSCVYSYYNQETEKMDVMEQQTEALDLHTNALQILLGETPCHILTFSEPCWFCLNWSDWCLLVCSQRRLYCSALTWPLVSGC